MRSKSFVDCVKYSVVPTEKVGKENNKEIEIVFMYQLDIMKLLEIIAMDKLQREEEDRIKRWNKTRQWK